MVKDKRQHYIIPEIYEPMSLFKSHYRYINGHLFLTKSKCDKSKQIKTHIWYDNNGNVKTMLLNMKKDVQKQNITDDENKDYGVSDQEIIRIAR